jgi:PhoH-like ATPase
MQKNYVLDTNVLLHDPSALRRFEDNQVIVPIYVIEEIDRFKKELSEKGRNAREIARQLDQYRGQGGLADGIALEGGGTLRVALGGSNGLPNALNKSQEADNLILAAALAIRDRDKGQPTILVTKDVNLRIRADAHGLRAEDYDSQKVDFEELYSGHVDLQVPTQQVDAFYQDGGLAIDKVEGLQPSELYSNQFVNLRDRDNGSHTAIGRYDATAARLVPVRKLRDTIWGIRPRNREQSYALDLLLNDDIKLVTLVGKAGTGKTLLAIAAGLQKSADESVYHKLLVSRPIFPLGRDIGYLPGDIEEKLNPWMQPIYDNIELLLGFTKNDKKDGRSYHELVDMGLIEIEPLTYIRGRSIPYQYMIVDEAQNLTPHEVKTILTRAGDNTKIVLTGDPYQIDNPYIDSESNGLTTTVERFKSHPIAGHITLSKGERSPLAELAANVL